MSDTADATATETTETKPTATEDTSTTEETDWKAEAEKWKALSRKNESRAKENEAASKRLAEIEQEKLSEQEKLTQRAEAAEKRAAELEASVLRNTIAAEKGVPAKLLTGTTEEELRASADELIRFRGPAATTDFGAGKPGTKDISDKKPTQLTREALKSMTPAEIVKAKNDGRLADLLAPKK
jgi:membrane-associated HD superfamily phosphohydrolase